MRITSCIIIMLYAFTASAQIDIKYNTPRVGDEIIKQQVQYKDPGRDGENVIWNFGELKSINEGWRNGVEQNIESHQYHYRNQQTSQP